ncbi:MAG TPA: ABC transporter permease, partial [Miltoncostaeaceae bacterium]|nr:ABC transporter permease [Miltoncostaeaceae bacterium]
RRNLLRIRRLPQLLVFATVQPLLLVLMFRYVFGGAIMVPGVDYVNYLMAGVFTQVVAFGAITTAVGLAEDNTRGLLERLRSLPMTRSAVLAGRTFADVVRNVFVVALMLIVGFAVGFRLQTDVAKMLLALAVLLAFGYSLSWIFALIGLVVKGSETAQAASFPIMMVLVFASSAFVPTATMPGWLRVWADHQPVSVTVNAVRALLIGGPWGAQLLASVAWSAAMLVVFVPLAVRRYLRG